MKRGVLILCLVVCAFASADEARLTLGGQIEGTGTDIRVFRGESETPLFGSVAREGGVVRFAPALPLVSDETYRVEVQNPGGGWSTRRLRFEKAGTKTPTVRVAPFPAVLPANALKLYLHFSQPMEQGVFLDRISLLRQDGSIVHGAFRETELWSPDGMRLTLWLHPGRQKTGVNLNRDEGPVLIEGERHVLKVSGGWRSTAGTALGEDVTFAVSAGPPDHERPDPGQWRVDAPKAGTQKPLVVTFNEGMDPAMLGSSLRVQRGGALLHGAVEVARDARQWSFTPLQPWENGAHTIQVEPLLEDLAGNNLLHPFEVDGTQPIKDAARPRMRTFDVAR